MDLIFELKQATKPGIYLLVNEAEKLVYISYSSNMAEALARNLSSNKFVTKGWEFKVLEIVTDPINLRPRCQYFKDLYSSNGYVIMNPRRVCNLKVSIELVKGFRPGDMNLYLPAVKIVSSGFYSLTVGVFNSYAEVDEFLQKYYARNIVTEIIYSSNSLTEEYFQFLEKS